MRYKNKFHVKKECKFYIVYPTAIFKQQHKPKKGDNKLEHGKT